MHNNRIDPVYHQDMFEFYYVAYNNKNKKLFKGLIKKNYIKKKICLTTYLYIMRTNYNIIKFKILFYVLQQQKEIFE